MSDPTGDFLGSYQGPHNADLDVTSFSVDLQGSQFVISGTMAGAIDTAASGVYVIGVDTGTGVKAPFGNIGEPDVIFNQTIDVAQNGTASIGTTSLGKASIVGSTFTVDVATKLLPSTGFQVGNYGFTLWPEAQLGVETQISDFAPDNASISVGISTVPLPSSLPLLATGLIGFGLAGAGLRRRKAAARA